MVGEALGRLLGHEGGALINGIMALIKETQERSLALFLPCEVTTRSWCIFCCHDWLGKGVWFWTAYRENLESHFLEMGQMEQGKSHRN